MGLRDNGCAARQQNVFCVASLSRLDLKSTRKGRPSSLLPNPKLRHCKVSVCAGSSSYACRLSAQLRAPCPCTAAFSCSSHRIGQPLLTRDRLGAGPPCRPSPQAFAASPPPGNARHEARPVLHPPPLGSSTGLQVRFLDVRGWRPTEQASPSTSVKPSLNARSHHAAVHASCSAELLRQVRHGGPRLQA
jgi:hypothetical protein